MPFEMFKSVSPSTSSDPKGIPFAQTPILAEAQDATIEFLCLAGDLIDNGKLWSTMLPKDASLNSLLNHLTERGIATHDESFNLFFMYRGRRISVNNAISFKAALTMMKNEGRTLFNFVFDYATREILMEAQQKIY